MIRDIVFSVLMGCFMGLVHEQRFAKSVNLSSGIILAVVFFILLRVLAYVFDGPLFSR